MADPIEAHYTPDGDDWTIAVTGRGRTLTGRAPGLIAARDRADQLVEQLAPEESGRKTVVHLLNGDAVEFTTAYLTARLARTEEPAPTETTEATEAEARPDAETEAPAAEEDTAGEETSPAPAEGSPAAVNPAPEVPEPATSTEGHRVTPSPTPRPRTESQTAQPAHQPAPEEETASSGS